MSTEVAFGHGYLLSAGHVIAARSRARYRRQNQRQRHQIFRIVPEWPICPIKPGEQKIWKASTRLIISDVQMSSILLIHSSHASWLWLMQLCPKFCPTKRQS
jgi:hypothetical protein